MALTERSARAALSPPLRGEGCARGNILDSSTETSLTQSPANFHFIPLSSSLAGAVGTVGNAGGFWPAFSKSWGKARLHRGFPQDGSFHSPILFLMS